MPRKKAEPEQQADAPIAEDVKDAAETTSENIQDVAEDATNKAGDIVAAVSEKVGDAAATAGDAVAAASGKVGKAVTGAKDKASEVIAPVGEKIADAASTIGDRVGDLVANITGSRDDSTEEEPVVSENEVLPTTISKGTATTAGTELPEYLQRRRTEIGRVVSNKMQKTVVVSVERSKQHALYKKVVRQTVKFMAHDEMSSGMGDTVRIIESRPMSRHKRWRVIEIVQKAERI